MVAEVEEAAAVAVEAAEGSPAVADRAVVVVAGQGGKSLELRVS